MTGPTVGLDGWENKTFAANGIGTLSRQA